MPLFSKDRTRLKGWEAHFQEELARINPKLLGEIIVSPEEIDEMGPLIGQVFRSVNSDVLAQDYLLTISLFLVWCSVYHYKEGALWRPIISKTGLEELVPNAIVQMGELLLTTIDKYNLQSAPAEKRKKYMTPILMHGYISDYYASQLLDYLNAIYSSYLEYDLSAQALENLWSDVFNLDQEQVNVRDNMERLKAEKNNIANQMSKFELPSLLGRDSKKQISGLQEEILVLKKAVEEFEGQKYIIKNNLQEMQTLFSGFQECSVTLTELDEEKPVRWNSAFLEIMTFIQPIEAGFRQELVALKDEEKAVTKELQNTQNILSITQSRRSALMTEVVKLGQGSLVKGYAILDEYTELSSRLEELKIQQVRWGRLLEQNRDLGNSTVRQVLTTSLTSLAATNPSLFQSFIQKTLTLLDSSYRQGSSDVQHRMSKPLQLWLEERKETEKIVRRTQVHLASGDSEESKRKGKIVGVRQVQLRKPSLKYGEPSRLLSIYLPEQNLRTPAEHNEEPFVFMQYAHAKDELKPRFYVAGGRMHVEAQELPLINADFQGITFIWYNLHEYWSFELDPVMVFDKQGERQDGSQFSNGFYYILAQNDWNVSSDYIVDKYHCKTPNYTVFEVHVSEGVVEFTHPQGAPVSLTFSSHGGISMQEVAFLPGIRHDGLPVAVGTPKLSLSRTFLAQFENELLFTLHHNGAKTLELPLESILERGNQGAKDEIVQLNLEDLVGQKYKPRWSTFKLTITSASEDIKFQRAFCLTRGLRFRFEDDHLAVEVPSRSLLRAKNEQRNGKSYSLPTAGLLEVSFEIYFPRIGWKEFTVTIPSGEVHLINDEGVLETPLHLVGSETNELKNLKIRLETLTSVVRKVTVSDRQESLVLNFSVSKGGIEIPLGGFSDLFSDVAEENEIYLRCTGQLGAGSTQSLVKVHSSIEIEEAELFPSEMQDKYLLELNFSTTYPDYDKLRFRIKAEGSDGKKLVERRIRSTRDIFYLSKSELKSPVIYGEIYYLEEITSVFGNFSQEHICWSEVLTLPNKMEQLHRAQEEGLILKGFLYGESQHVLPRKYEIFQIEVTSTHFEGEELELMRGVIDLDGHLEEVFFFLEENNIIPGLWDLDQDGVQYDPKDHSIFWELRGGRDIMGPLENIKFSFGGMSNDES